MHAHRKAHLHTMKVVMILIPSFHGLCQEHLGLCRPFWERPMKKKKKSLHFCSLALLQQARAIRDIGYVPFFTVTGVKQKERR